MPPVDLSDLGLLNFGPLVVNFAPGKGCCLGVWIGSCTGILRASLWGLMSRRR